ncbi:MAG TPA: phage tail protein [Cytophagaceae bacterium]|jgi:phage tail-like protein|nr:phage tail protein [Cytophagaceae bacterium]
MIDYPLPGFYFQLSFSGISGTVDTSFKEVSGLVMEMGTEEIAEGGENRFKHRVPTGTKYQNLVLKRGLVAATSDLVTWCTNSIGGGLSDTILPKTIVVSLLDENGNPLKSWNIANAWPVKWETSSFNSMNNEVAIETLEFSFSYFQQL